MHDTVFLFKAITIVSKWLYSCFSFLIYISAVYQTNLCYLVFIYLRVYVTLFSVHFFLYILHFYNWFIFKTSYTFSEGKGHIHTLNKMIVKYLCSVCSGALTKNTKQYSVIVLIGWFILLVTIMSTYTENYKWTNHHVIVCTVLKRKCHSVLLKMKTFKNSCTTKLFHLHTKYLLQILRINCSHQMNFMCSQGLSK